MSFLTLLGIAVGLSMDAFAVAVANGFAIKQLKVGHALKIAFFFGGFQALMPLIGWFCGLGLKSFIAPVDHWIAFGILSVIGGKMIYESRKVEKAEKEVESGDVTGFVKLLFLAVATSIDALAVGLSLTFLKVSIFFPVLVIGGVTFVISYAGVYLGNRFGHFCEKFMELTGGFILIGIGAKILLEHLMGTV